MQLIEWTPFAVTPFTPQVHVGAEGVVRIDAYPEGIVVTYDNGEARLIQAPGGGKVKPGEIDGQPEEYKPKWIGQAELMDATPAGNVTNHGELANVDPARLAVDLLPSKRARKRK